METKKENSWYLEHGRFITDEEEILKRIELSPLKLFQEKPKDEDSK